VTRRRIRALAHDAEHLRLMLAYHDAPRGDRRRRLRDLRAYVNGLLAAVTA